ncbi:MAG: hypothetical protein ACE5JF_11100 [Anaerolineales bacterium]
MQNRLVPLIIGLVSGLLIAVVYGWLVRPVEYIDTSPDSLRIDFRTDYVLMVAESYSAEQDLTLAQVRLAALGPQAPDDYVTQAIDYALVQSFSRPDLERLNRLAIALRTLQQPGGIGPP